MANVVVYLLNKTRPLKWLIVSLCVLANAAHSEWHSDQQGIMGTDINVQLWHEDARIGKQAVAAVMEEMRRIDRTLSPYIDSSELANTNLLAAQKPVTLSPEFTMLIDKSLYFSQVTGGAFDITFASIGQHYDYRDKKKPSTKLSESLKGAIDYHHLQFNKKTRTLSFKHPDVKIDLGGIAKGYAVDQAIEIAKSLGVKHASIGAGGDTRLLGDRRGRPWILGVKNPRIDEGDDRGKPSVLTLPLSNVAISTSGDYERFFIDPTTGERIHHIINPKTGRSASGIISASVLGPNSIDTDALSTSVFVLGVKRGLALINRLNGFDCVIIDEFGKVHYSQGLAPPQ